MVLYVFFYTLLVAGCNVSWLPVSGSLTRLPQSWVNCSESSSYNVLSPSAFWNPFLSGPIDFWTFNCYKWSLTISVARNGKSALPQSWSSNSEDWAAQDLSLILKYILTLILKTGKKGTKHDSDFSWSLHASWPSAQSSVFLRPLLALDIFRTAYFVVRHHASHYDLLTQWDCLLLGSWKVALKNQPALPDPWTIQSWFPGRQLCWPFFFLHQKCWTQLIRYHSGQDGHLPSLPTISLLSSQQQVQ